MPQIAQINNPAGAYGLPATGDVEVILLVNGTGGTVLPGDILCYSTDGVTGVTPTTATLSLVAGVVAPKDLSTRTVASTETYASGAVVPVVVRGLARVNIGAGTAAVGSMLTGTNTTRAATLIAVSGGAAANIGNVFGVLPSATAKDANNCAVAVIGMRA